jgi:hypothetical protein
MSIPILFENALRPCPRFVPPTRLAPADEVIE